MSAGESPPEKERGRLATGPEKVKGTIQPPPVVNRETIEAFVDQLLDIEDVLSDAAISHPDKYALLLRPAVRLRVARREISEFMQRRLGP
jgi:hypothetical protein